MSRIIKPVALNETVVELNQTTVATNTKLDDIKAQLALLAGMPDQIEQVLSDYSDTMANILGENGLSGSISSTLQGLSSSISSTLDDLASDLNDIFNGQNGLCPTIESILSAFSDDMVSAQNDTTDAITDLGQALVGVLASVKSVNGETGDVVIDGTKLKMNRTQQGSKTVTQMLNEMNAAIAETPLNFSAELITGTTDEYMVVVTEGTPS